MSGLVVVLLLLTAGARCNANCTWVETAVITSLNPVCPSITFVDVTFSASVSISISDIVASPMATGSGSITVSFLRCIVQGYQVVISLTSSSLASSAPPPSVSISLKDMSFRDSAVLITGTFPPATTIVMMNSSMVTTDVNSLPSFSKIASSPISMIMLYQVALQGPSSIVAIVNCSLLFGVKEQQGVMLIQLTSTFSLARGSAFLVSGTTVNKTDSDGCAMTFNECAVNISEGSQWSLQASSLSTNIFATFLINFCTIQLLSGSVLLVQGSALLSNGTYGFYLARSNMTLDDGSRFSFDQSSAYAFTDGTPFRVVQMNVNVLFGSSFQITSTQLYATTYYAMRFESSTLTIRSNSTWIIDNCTLQSLQGAGGMFLQTMTFFVQSMSQLIWRNTTFTAVAANIFVGVITVIGGIISVSSGSAWMMEGCRAAATTSAGTSMSFSGAAVQITDSSTWSWSGGHFHGAVKFESSRILISGLSLWDMTNSVVLEGAGPVAALRLDSFGSISLRNMSVFALIGAQLIGGGSEAVSGFQMSQSSVFALQIESTLTIDGLSEVVWRGCDFRCTSTSSTCISVRRVAVSNRGMWRLLDNNCAVYSSSVSAVVFSASSSLLQAAMKNGLTVDSVSESVSPFTTIVDRCNRLTLFRSSSSAVGDAPSVDLIGDLAGVMPILGTLLCQRCNLLVDCFRPLTSVGPGSFTPVECGRGVEDVKCPCLVGCGGLFAASCFPGAATGNAPGPCSLNLLPRPELNMSMTLAGTRTHTRGSATLSAAAPEPPPAPPGSHQPQGIVVVLTISLIFSGGGPLALAMQRTVAQNVLNSCGTDSPSDDGSLDFSSNPTQLKLGSDNYSAERGCVVGNLLLWSGFISVALLVTAFLRRRHHFASMAVAAETVSLPGLLSFPYTTLVVPTVLSSTVLVANARAGVALGIVGLIACCGPLLILLLITTVFFRARGKLLLRPGYDYQLAQRHFGNMWEWVNLQSHVAAAEGHGGGFVEGWGSLFDRYRPTRQWFASIETLVALTIAALAGASIGSSASCTQLQWSACVTNVVFFLLVAFLRPYNVSSDSKLAIINSAVTMLSSILGLANMDTSLLTSIQVVLGFIGVAAAVTAFVADGSLAEWSRCVANIFTRGQRVIRAKKRTIMLLKKTKKLPSQHSGASGGDRPPRGGAMLKRLEKEITFADDLHRILLANGGVVDASTRIIVLTKLIRTICEGLDDEVGLQLETTATTTDDPASDE